MSRVPLCARSIISSVANGGRLQLIPKLPQVKYQSSAASNLQSLEEEHKLWVKSPLPDVDTVVDFTIPELIRENMGPWGNLPAFECAETGVTYTHDEVLNHARGFGAALIKMGLKQGQVVGIVLANCPEYASVLYGIWEAGLIASPVNPAYTSDEITRQLESSGSVCAVTSGEYLASVRTARDSNPQFLKSIVVVGEPAQGCHTFKEMIKQDTFGVEFFKGKSCNTLETIGLLPYSSGTTGAPKGVMLTHANLTTNLVQADPDLGVCLLRKTTKDLGQERFIAVLPFFHSYGMHSIMNAGMYIGSHVLVMPKFKDDIFLKSIKKHKPTLLHLVTPLISHIVNSANYGPSELAATHSVIGAAAPIGGSLIHGFLDKAGKYITFQEGYGMTELSPCSHILLPTTKNMKIGSCGTPVSSTLTKIVDTKTGEALGPNQRGEICVKGPQVMKGYYNNPQATKDTIDEQGWLHTGDVGYYDEDKCMYIVDRIKELIKVKGMQVAPSELEDLLREHSEVEDVAVIGVPDTSDAGVGERPRAYIVRKSTSVTEQDIHEFLKPKIVHYKRLKGGIEWRTSIPKAPSGKILRRELIDEYRKKNNIIV